MAISKTYAGAAGDSANGGALSLTGVNATGYVAVVAFAKHEGTPTALTPSGNQSGTWQSLTKRNHANGDLSAQMFWAPLTSPSTGMSVTITPAANRPYRSLDVWLVDADGGAVQLDAQTDGEGTSGSTAVDAGSLATSGASVVSFFGVGPYSGVSCTPGSGWAPEDFDGASGGVTHHAMSRGPETTSPIDPVSTNSAGADWAACAASFKEATTAYTLAAAQGSYALTGQAAAVRAARRFAAGQGSYNLSGQAAGLRRGFPLLAGQGSYSLSGQDVALRLARAIVAAQGSYALSGQAANLIYDAASAVLQAGFGSYALAGQSSGLLAARILTALQGSYGLSGQSAATMAARLISAAQGSYGLSGQVALLAAARRLVAAYGNYSLTGYDAALTSSAAALAEARDRFVCAVEDALFSAQREDSSYGVSREFLKFRAD